VRLKALGLSAPKIRTLRATADAVVTGTLPLDTLHRLEAEEAVEALTAVKGIGPWTADIYLLFCLGHSDAFPAGDLALQEAARVGFRMRARPDAAKLEKLARRWRPYRGVAAKLLWAYYRVMKAGREAAPAGD
jgi:DNA-3-methyladenine glycosylase II